MRCRKENAVLIAAALVFGANSANAQNWADSLVLDPQTWPFGSYELRLGGFAHGAAFAASQSSGPARPEGTDESGATGEARAELRLQRIYDSGLIVGAQSRVLIVRDELSGDIYGNDALEKFYLYVQTGLGRVELGQQDGAAYTIGVTAPTVDEYMTLENPGSTIFRDPATRKAFNAFTQELTVVASSSNLLKFNYLTPRVFGAQIGLSFTPSPVKAPLPFIGNPSNLPNVQASIWEIAGAYTTRISDVAVGMSLAYSRGALRNPTPGHGSLHDFAAGLTFAYDIDQIRLAGGAAYRVSNGYGFAPGSALADRKLTQRAHLSAMISRGPWRAGGEYAFGDLDGFGALPDIDMSAWQVAAGYRPNADLQISVGWQWYDYERNFGVFSNGAGAIDMNGAFLSLSYAVR